MPTVEVVHWNPDRPVLPGPLGRRIPWRRPLNNFGDLIGPFVVDEMLRRKGLRQQGGPSARRIVTVGSIMRLARSEDVVWGTGVNGKSLGKPLAAQTLDIRAVRGPRTREVMISRGFDVPGVYGDPALLLGELWGREHFAGDTPRRPLTVIPNLNDLSSYPKDDALVPPTRPLQEVLSAIAASDFVTGSSLHAIVIADALGVPSRLVRSGAEPLFKYEDYYSGSGRTSFEPAESVAAAVRAGGETPLAWDAAPLLEAFPFDLWQ